MPLSAKYEEDRIAALARYDIIDTPEEKQFDDLVRLAGQICDAPIAVINFVQTRRQWFKAKIGLDVSELPLELSACKYAILSPELTIVPDMREDERFITNPLVTGEPELRFYAGAPLHNPDGHCLGTICVLDTRPRDLTEGQKAALLTLSAQVMTLLELRLALREKQETRTRYQLLFESMDEAFCIIEAIFDDNGNAVDYLFLETNPAFAIETGMADAVGRRMRDIAPGHEQYWFDIFGSIVKTGEPTRFTNYAARHDRWFDVYAFPFSQSDGKKISIVFSDVTERRASEIALRKSEAHLNLMLESAQDYAIISLSAEGTIQSWNAGAEHIFGHGSADVIGKSFAIIFTEEDRHANAPAYEMETAAKNGRANDERWHKRANGERFYASGILNAMYDENQNLTGFVKIARDITERQHHQEALMEARNAAEAANIAKTEFLANMSHEIRTPMNAIMGLSTILARSSTLTEKQRQFIKTLQMSADSMLSLINDLLDIAKIEARTVELEQIPFSITQLIQEVISMMAVRVSEKGLQFTAEGESLKYRMFLGDPTRIRQIILNLCSNAIKFTDNGGIHVSLVAHPTADPSIECVTITVKDTGIGIAKEKLDTIFEKFVQADSSINRKYGGTGLGLAITKTIAEIMGGTIKVESIVGQGSTFIVDVPLKVATEEEIKTFDGSNINVISQPVGSGPQQHVLLVEDYIPNVLVATTVLEDFGYIVEVATNGKEAVEKAKTGQFIAILMDVQMHTMNGLEATAQIRAHEKSNSLPRIPIIGMTAHALAGDRERCIGAGMDEYIAKPFNPDDLKQKLQVIIDS